MKNLILLFFLTFYTNIAYSQDSTKIDTSLCKIYIIGVVHSANKYRNEDSLFEILTKIKPDLILSETDTLSGFFNKDYTLNPRPNMIVSNKKRKLKNAEKYTPEMEVLYSYLQSNPNTSIYPFDQWVPNRNQYNYYKMLLDNKWDIAMNEAIENEEISNSFLKYHEVYKQYTRWFNSLLGLGYFELNQKALSNGIRQMAAFEETYFPKVYDSVPRLNSFKELRSEDSKFWKLRNEAMVNNILRFTEMEKAKKVVILTGLLHKYYFIDNLQKNTRNKIQLVEYYEE
jgi:hypothetical protein